MRTSGRSGATVRVVVDAGNGTAGPVAPERLSPPRRPRHRALLRRWTGAFPNHHPDPTVPENLRELIARGRRDGGAELGIAFDGDADRIGVVDARRADHLGRRAARRSSRATSSRGNPGAIIVSEVKCSQRLYDDIAQHGGRGIMWKAGHSLLKAKMKETGALLGGEMSGHIFFEERYFGYDDAIYAGARLLEILGAHRDAPSASCSPTCRRRRPRPRSASTARTTVKFEVAERVRDRFRAEGRDIIDVDGVRVRFPHGWGLLRASNTQPVLVMRFEADTPRATSRSTGGPSRRRWPRRGPSWADRQPVAGSILVRGAREHNLKNIDVEIPRERLVVITGLSGLGQVVARLRHDLRRGAAPLRRVALGLRPPVPRADGEARLRRASRASRRRSRSSRRAPGGTRARPSARSPRSPTTCACSSRASAPVLLRSAAGRSRRRRCSRSSTACSRCPRRRASSSTRRSCATGRASTASELDELRRGGFVRVRIDGELRELGDDIVLARDDAHTIEVLVDRLVVRPGVERAARRLARRRASRTATARCWSTSRAGRRRAGDRSSSASGSPARLRRLVPGAGAALLLVQQPARRVPRRATASACSAASIPALVVPRPDAPLPDGAGPGGGARAPGARGASCAALAGAAIDFRRETPFAELPEDAPQRAPRRHGRAGRSRSSARGRGGATSRRPFPGILALARATPARDAARRWLRDELEGLIADQPLPDVRRARGCGARRASSASAGGSIVEVRRSRSATRSASSRGSTLAPAETRDRPPRSCKEIVARLGFLVDVGLDYLTLDRGGGDALRRRGAAHPARDADRLAAHRRALRARRAVDRPPPARQRAPARDAPAAARPRQHRRRRRARPRHDPRRRPRDRHGPGRRRPRRRASSPRAAGGDHGAIRRRSRAATSPAREAIPVPAQRRRGAADGRSGSAARAPTTCAASTSTSRSGTMTCVTGRLRLRQEHARHRHALPRAGPAPGRRARGARARTTSSRGWQMLDKVIEIDQAPIGRTPRSNPATYTGVFAPDPRALRAAPRGARARLRPGPVLVQREGRALRGVRRRRR